MRGGSLSQAKAAKFPRISDLLLPGVGENLQDHLQIRSVYKVQGTGWGLSHKTRI